MDEYQETAQLGRQWIEHLRATEPGEPWWENLVDALVGLDEPILPVLTGHLTDRDRAVALGVAVAIERIAQSRQTSPA